MTEKLVLPFVFSALGCNVDRAAISIIECGGKPNIPLFARICRATGIPSVVVHDSDRKASGRLAPAERALNALIVESAARRARSCLTDLEASLAWRATAASPSKPGETSPRPSTEMPEPLVHVAEFATSFARS
jgi:hypothetical protein